MIPRPKCGQRLPLVLDTSEVERLIEVTTNRKHRALLMTVYSAGLRVSEVVLLKPHHIDSKREQIRIEQGKGRRDRYTLLSKRLLQELKEYWRLYRPKTWLFSSPHADRPLITNSAGAAYKKWAQRAGITKAGGIHLLRKVST